MTPGEVRRWREEVERAGREAVESAIPSLMGAEAVYWTRQMLLFVRLESIRTSDCGVAFRMVPVAAPGLPLEDGPPYYDEDAPWDLFRIGNQSLYWHPMLLLWSLFFDPRLIRNLKALGDRFTDSDDTSERRRRLRDYVDDYQNLLISQDLWRHASLPEDEDFYRVIQHLERKLRVPGDEGVAF